MNFVNRNKSRCKYALHVAIGLSLCAVVWVSSIFSSVCFFILSKFSNMSVYYLHSQRKGIQFWKEKTLHLISLWIPTRISYASVPYIVCAVQDWLCTMLNVYFELKKIPRSRLEKAQLFRVELFPALCIIVYIMYLLCWCTLWLFVRGIYILCHVFRPHWFICVPWETVDSLLWKTVWNPLIYHRIFHLIMYLRFLPAPPARKIWYNWLAPVSVLLAKMSQALPKLSSNFCRLRAPLSQIPTLRGCLGTALSHPNLTLKTFVSPCHLPSTPV